MPRLVHGADVARCCSLVAWRRICLAACCLASVSRLVVIVLGAWPSSELALPELLAELQTLAPRNLSLASGWCGHMGFTESRRTGAIACARISTRHQRRARVVFAGCARDVSSRLTNVVSMLARLEEQVRIRVRVRVRVRIKLGLGLGHGQGQGQRQGQGQGQGQA